MLSDFLIRHFVKDYQQTDDPHVREEYGKFSGKTGIASNLLLTAMKIIAGLISGSIAVVADGINNLTDASSSVITLVGFHLAGKPEDRTHPYGHERIEYLTGMIISVIIVLVGAGLFSSSFKKIRDPQEVEAGWLTIGILVASIVIKLWQSSFYNNVSRRINSLTLKATATDSRNDVISTAVVLAGIIIARFTGLHLDGWLGCFVAVFIIWSGVQLLRETTSPLLGEAPDEDLVNQIKTIALKHKGVLGIHDLAVHNYGPGKIFASMHVEVDADGELMASHDMIDNIEREIKEGLHIEFVIHMDPIKVGDPLVDKLNEVLRATFKPLSGVAGMHDLRIVPGPTHTNVIFDVVLDPDCEYSEDELQGIATAAIRTVDPNLFAVITFDKAYSEF
ncbi:MAG: cation diffusion facilitator family transporter [Anaerovoracaceae bacterium]|jgi:cation diffusion facilitator family transporter